VREVICQIKKKVVGNNREEFDRIIKGIKVTILGKGTGIKDAEEGRIHTVPVLLTCGCRYTKDQSLIKLGKMLKD
jgi:hypothetical protein